MRIAQNIGENLGLALETIWANKVRSALTLLGVVVGTMTIIAVGSVLTGMNARVEQITEKFGPNVAFVSKFDQIGIRFGRLSREERMRKDLTAEDAEAIGQLPSVITSPRGRLNTVIATRGGSRCVRSRPCTPGSTAR